MFFFNYALLNLWTFDHYNSCTTIMQKNYDFVLWYVLVANCLERRVYRNTPARRRYHPRAFERIIHRSHPRVYTFRTSDNITIAISTQKIVPALFTRSSIGTVQHQHLTRQLVLPISQAWHIFCQRLSLSFPKHFDSHIPLFHNTVFAHFDPYHTSREIKTATVRFKPSIWVLCHPCIRCFEVAQFLSL